MYSRILHTAESPLQITPLQGLLVNLLIVTLNFLSPGFNTFLLSLLTLPSLALLLKDQGSGFCRDNTFRARLNVSMNHGNKNKRSDILEVTERIVLDIVHHLDPFVETIHSLAIEIITACKLLTHTFFSNSSFLSIS